MVQPKSGAQGADFLLEMQYKVENKTGTGEIVVDVQSTSGPGGAGDGFLLAPQAAGTVQDVTVKLSTQPSEQDPWNPGEYRVTWAICEGGSCGEKHGRVLAVNSGSSFTITGQQ